MATPHRYSIWPKDPAAHLFEVRVTVATPQAAGQVFALPTWIPGSYMIRDYAKHVVSVRAESDGRDVALVRLSNPEMDEHFLTQEFEYVANKLDLTVAELQQIFDGENKTYCDYKNKRWAIGIGSNVMRFLGLERRLFR